MTIVDGLVGLVTGILSGAGIGGGSLLMLYLTTVAGMGQTQAGGINLLYFVGCAPSALVGHIRHHRVDPSAAWWCVAAGVPTAIAASLLATSMDIALLRRGFGVLLLFIGTKELLAKSPQKVNKK